MYKLSSDINEIIFIEAFLFMPFQNALYQIAINMAAMSKL